MDYEITEHGNGSNAGRDNYLCSVLTKPSQGEPNL